MGCHATLDTVKPGYFPDVIGEVALTIKSLAEGEALKPIDLLERQGPLRIIIHSNASCAQSLIYFNNVFKSSLVAQLEKNGVSPECVTFNEPVSFPPIKGKAKTLAVTAVLQYDNLTCLTASALVDGTSQLHNNRKDYAEELATEITMLANSPACVDEHHTDQLLVYMAMAEGLSRMKALKPLSLHTQTMLALLPMFRPDLAITTSEPSGEEAVMIEVKGLAMKN